MEAAIEASGLRKRFGSAVALDGMTFTVWPGEITGFAGPNGAGKSTTMRMIPGLGTAGAGTALIGERFRSLRHPVSRVGSLLDAAALQPCRSARTNLLWLAHSPGPDCPAGDTVIGQAGLGEAARRKTGEAAK
jgi:ABC-2 type transport system ATP-binding protein